MKTHAALMVGALLLLGGCAGFSPEDCARADWRGVGFEDGAKGRPPTYLAQRAERCFAAGAPVDRDAWESGRVEGLRAYCQPENGHALGRSGARYGGQCPADLEPAFLKAFVEGQQSGLRPSVTVGVGLGGHGRGWGWGMGLGWPIW